LTPDTHAFFCPMEKHQRKKTLSFVFFGLEAISSVKLPSYQKVVVSSQIMNNLGMLA
jgi:Tfp pilus assembly major pilin PilA